MKGDSSNHIRNFLMANVAESSRIWNLLKALSMSVIAPPYIIIKKINFKKTFKLVLKMMLDLGQFRLSLTKMKLL